MSQQSFADLGVSGAVCGALAARGIEEPFAIQRLVIADVLAGHDVLAKSPTGSGKTLAFAVPIADRLAAGEHVGDDEALDGERLFDAARGERAAHGIGHAEIGEGLLGQGKWLLAAHGPRTVREATADPETAREREPSKLPRG